MATTQKSSFAPTATLQMSVSPTGETETLPTTGTPLILRVMNPGPFPVWVLLGTGSSVSVTPQTGMQIAPGDTEWMTIGANTALGAVTAFGYVQLNLTVGN